MGKYEDERDRRLDEKKDETIGTGPVVKTDPRDVDSRKIKSESYLEKFNHQK